MPSRIAPGHLPKADFANIYTYQDDTENLARVAAGLVASYLEKYRVRNQQGER